MKASDLKAGQWFDFEGMRCRKTEHGYEYIDEMLINEWHNKQEVTPLPDCTGWDWEPPKESYAARQAAWVEANGIEVGSRVKVTRIAKSEEDGWGDSWGCLCNKYVGREGTVVTFSGQSGIRVSVDNDDWNYPYFVLEPVEPAPQPPLQVREGVKFFRPVDGGGIWVTSPFKTAFILNIGSDKAVTESILTHSQLCNSNANHRLPCSYEDAIQLLDGFPEGIKFVNDLIAEVPPPSESPVMETPKVVVPEIVPGEGWRLLAKDEPVQEGDEYFCLGAWQSSVNWQTCDGRQGWRCTYRRRITPEPEREATYRAFRSAEEFRPHRDRWIRNPSSSSVRQVEHYSDTHCNGIPYGMLVRNRVWDDDGTPVGVKEQANGKTS